VTVVPTVTVVGLFLRGYEPMAVRYLTDPEGQQGGRVGLPYARPLFAAYMPDFIRFQTTSAVPVPVEAVGTL
jgi:hypothetical protein